MLHKVAIRLPDGVSVHDVADASRAALRAFMVLPADKRQLAEWLVGPYRTATAFTTGNAPPSHDPHRPAGVAELVTHTKALLSRAIYASTSPGAEDLIRQLPAVVHVRPVVDQYDASGFAAFDVPRARLLDRGLSLLMADYLTRADDFLEEMPPWLDRTTGRSPVSGFITRVEVLPMSSRKTDAS